MPNHKTLPDTGFMRLASIIARPGQSPSANLRGGSVKDGRFPKPVKLKSSRTASDDKLPKSPCRALVFWMAWDVAGRECGAASGNVAPPRPQPWPRQKPGRPDGARDAAADLI